MEWSVTRQFRGANPTRVKGRKRPAGMGCVHFNPSRERLGYESINGWAMKA